ncbi:MAG TPA: hypothetical protein VMH02_07400 [Verrucomicrobiae bacterium]|nr:hypothetical protein [Verrucomicrobiae bacterium]
MKNARFAAVAASIMLGLSACAGAGGSAAVSGVNPSAATALAPAVIAAPLVAGQYNGTVTDSKYGKGKAVLYLSQTQGQTSAGGWMTQTFAGKNVQGAVAFGVSSSGAMTGTTIGLLANPCTYNVTAQYNTKTHVIKGSYSATHRCTSESGTFSLVGQCYYVVPSTTDLEKPAITAFRPC